MATPKMISVSKISEVHTAVNKYLTGNIENRIQTSKLRDLLAYMISANKQHVSIDDFNQKRSKSSMFSSDDLGILNQIIQEVGGFNGLKCSLTSNRVYFYSEEFVDNSNSVKKEKSALHLVTS
jgi:hypothetical protein